MHHSLFIYSVTDQRKFGLLNQVKVVQLAIPRYEHLAEQEVCIGLL